MLVGNKLDLDKERIVQQREGSALAKKYDIPFMEVSAKTGENIADVFDKIGQLIVDEYVPNRVQEKPRYSLSSNHQLAIKEEKKNCEC
jgi:Ras-related protein Rab-8A